MKLYVGNLPYTFTEDDLSNLFTEYGSVVSAKLIFDRVTNRSKGFGFVEMSSSEEGEQSIKELNGREIGSRSIVVNEARPQEKRENRFSKKRS